MKHIPVLENEILDTFTYLNSVKDGFFVDGTLGLAGHSVAIISKFKAPISKFKIIGIDKDQSALELAKNNIKNVKLENRFIFVHDDFKNIENILSELKIDEVNGSLIDLGVSSMQLDDKERGFSFSDSEAILDMRMDQTQKLSAFDILNYYPQLKLEKILKEYGEEKFYRNIARNICKTRKESPIEKVGDLLKILEESVPTKVRATSKKHFATSVFRALRLEVNQELIRLDDALLDFISALKKGGRLAVVSFHSAEDRIVKETFRKAENPCVCPPLAPVCTCGNKPLVKILTKKPIVPSDQEITENPRSRSAKLRIVEKL
ncbi:MAG: 16S rRNA (cytosine(1402)-N(4))-methyltransferase RsmH [Patescibacteria group bacterium]|nr:16S rRNA (cytosine(1402)-N(4))-methyltransferase RsmH [Patescibacteria group bacterium]